MTDNFNAILGVETWKEEAGSGERHDHRDRTLPSTFNLRLESQGSAIAPLPPEAAID